MNIQLIKDIPERGRRWTAGTIVYGVDRAWFQKYIDSGHVREIYDKEPIWKKEEEESDDISDYRAQKQRDVKGQRRKKRRIF
mgnify:CR=1 FL=1